MSLQGTSSLDIVTPPAVEPVTLAEAREKVRVTTTSRDSELLGMIQSAREFVEAFTGRSIITQTLRLDLPCFENRIYLPRGKVQSVTSVQYLDGNGDLQTLASSGYLLVKPRLGASYLDLAYGASWPSARPVANGVQITYVAGYEATNSPADLRGGVPAAIKTAIKKLVQAEYDDLKAEDREALVKSAHVMLWPFRLLSF